MFLNIIFIALGLLLIVLGIQKVSVIDLLLGAAFFGFSAYDLYKSQFKDKDKN
ncbi:hypothetical protein [Marinomonas sp. 2405UD68-3]|uniref:hypothetical protein n=1 Tax=Marinomonas sp. 2405UD68-3 TaxID=3391835 RepID=UPI0039C9C278